jgi:hypothetical protein
MQGNNFKSATAISHFTAIAEIETRLDDSSRKKKPGSVAALTGLHGLGVAKDALVRN